MKHHVSLALLLTLLAALTLALLPPITNEPHYLSHRKGDRNVSVRQSYAPLDMTELAGWTCTGTGTSGSTSRTPVSCPACCNFWARPADN
jgi:hypothetical protein